MKKLKHAFVVLVSAVAVTSCATSVPKAIPVDAKGSVRDIIDGLKDTQEMIHEGGDILHEFGRFRAVL